VLVAPPMAGRIIRLSQTGMRMDEVCSLEWSQVSLTRREIRLTKPAVSLFSPVGIAQPVSLRSERPSVLQGVHPPAFPTGYLDDEMASATTVGAVQPGTAMTVRRYKDRRENEL